jgi:5'-nucleotidase
MTASSSFRTLLRSRLAPLAAVLAAAALLAAAPRAQAPSTPYRILVTNDDGVHAPGILAVAQALQALGEVTIVAPAENQSGKGHSITISDPIYVQGVTLDGGLRAYSAAATPASCVKVALGALMKEKPDLVVSGINRGYNLGMVTYVSGTVGAAREAALQGIPAIAASLASEAHPGYGPAAEMVRRAAALVKAHGLGRGVFLNVNVPAGTLESLQGKGLMMARQSAQSGDERFEEQTSPSGLRYFWSVWHEPTHDPEGTDVWAVEHGYVAVTPLHAGEFDQAAFDRWKAFVPPAR